MIVPSRVCGKTITSTRRIQCESASTSRPSYWWKQMMSILLRACCRTSVTHVLGAPALEISGPRSKQSGSEAWAASAP